MEWCGWSELAVFSAVKENAECPYDLAMPEVELDPETLLSAYAQGVFPMGDAGGQVKWYSADPRGIIPLDAFHVPKTLAQLIRNGVGIDVRINHDFEQTMRACMKNRQDGTWINEAIIRAYTQLHEMGFAHSVETWWDGQLAGGLYGVSLGAAFFGESMFHVRRDASKIALVALVSRLCDRGYELLDTQASTPHLRRFGCIEIPATQYLQRLQRALLRNCHFE
jgi:leucyl/phenylalanyl-tRNA--protein transferase